jgi:hypothetical protein
VELDRYPLYQRLADLYRAAGADEQVAADLAWKKTRYWARRRR